MFRISHNPKCSAIVTVRFNLTGEKKKLRPRVLLTVLAGVVFGSAKITRSAFSPCAVILPNSSSISDADCPEKTALAGLPAFASLSPIVTPDHPLRTGDLGRGGGGFTATEMTVACETELFVPTMVAA